MPSAAASRTNVMVNQGGEAPTLTLPRPRGRDLFGPWGPGHALSLGLLPVRFRVLRLGGSDARRIDEFRRSTLPLFDVDAHAALRLPAAVERHGALDRVVRAGMQRRDQRLVLDAVRLLRCLSHTLPAAYPPAALALL